jgi:hypothetical protein
MTFRTFSAAIVLTLNLIPWSNYGVQAGVFDDPEGGQKAAVGKVLFEHPPFVLPSAEDTQTKRQSKVIGVASGSRVLLPGDWGPQGFVRVIVDRVPRPVRVLSWTDSGIQAQLPPLSLAEATEAKLVVVRENKRSFPPISLRLLPPSAKPADDAVSQAAPAGTFDDAVPEDVK